MQNSDLGTAGVSLAPLGTPTLTPTPAPARPPESFTRTWLLAGGLETPCPTPPGGELEAPVPGTPRYVPMRLLGRGGGGVVWLVHDVVLDREVALKVLSPDALEDAETRARFLFEARVAGRLGLPGVVPVFDAGVLPDGRCFYTMQFIEGPTLADALAARREGAWHALGRSTLLGALVDVARTLSAVHGQGIVHRDIKPANLIIGPGGAPWIADWGLAVRYTERPAQRAGARRMPITGTFGYMAPEALDGEPRHIGPAADVYALGACLFETLAGVLPHRAGEGGELNLLFQVRNVDAPDVRSVAPEAQIAPGLAALCHAALTREPARRTLTARAFADRLDALR